MTQRPVRLANPREALPIDEALPNRSWTVGVIMIKDPVSGALHHAPEYMLHELYGLR